MTKINITPYDVMGYLRMPEDCAAYLDACIAESQGDTDFIAKVIRGIDRARAGNVPIMSRGRTIKRELLL